MNRFATLVELFRFSRVTYYSVQFFEEQDITLFQEFLESHATEEFEKELAILRSWIRKIGEEIGAQERYFRHEAWRGGDARALPPPARHLAGECKLRLYCMRVNERAVILFGGGFKTARTAQECPNTRPHFILANRLCRVIQRAIQERDIEIDSLTGELIFDPNLELEL